MLSHGQPTEGVQCHESPIVNSHFRENFDKDLRAIRERSILARVKIVIESVEAAPNIRDIAGLKKLKGATDYYRIRVGQYRVGLIARGKEVVFVRILHRKDIYRYFP